MAFDAGAVTGRIELDAAKFLSELGKVDKRLASVESEVRKADKGFASFGGTLAKIAATIGTFVVGFVGVRAAFNGLQAAFTEATTEAAGFEQVIQNLGVTLSLRLGGSVSSAVDSLKEFADGIQRTTAFSDDLALGVAQQIALFGVGRNDLERYTKVVLDYSAATGIDATTAARQFGMTLDGTVGRLGEAVPALKGLTEEQARAGQAFEVAGRSLAGFSEAVAGTTQGIKTQLTNAFADLAKTAGVIVNPFLDKIREAITAGLMAATELVDANTGAVTEVVRNFALTLLNNVEGVTGAFTSMRLSVFDFVSTIQNQLPLALGTFKQLSLSAAELKLKFLEALDFIPGAEVKGLEAARKAVADLTQQVDGLAESFRDQTQEQEKGRKAIQDQGKAVQTFLVPFLDKARAAVRGITEDAVRSKFAFDGISRSSGGASESIQRGAAEAIKLQEALAASFREAQNLEGATGGVADNLSAAGSAAGGGGGGEGGGGFGAGIRKGGSVGLGLGGVEESLATLRAQSSGLQRAVAGGAQSFVIQGQQSVVENVAAIAQAQVTKAFSEFTADLVRELNSAGVLNQTERNSFISARLDEAQRLGVLPPRNAVSQITGQRF